MNLVPKEIKLADLVRIYPAFKTGKYVDNVAIAELEIDGPPVVFRHPCRFDGYLMVLCSEGTLCADLNLKSFCLDENTLFIYEPGSLVRFYLPDPAPHRPTRFRIAACTKDSIQEVEKDFTRMYSSSVAVHEDPLLSFSGEDIVTFNRYLDLAECLVEANNPGSTCALNSLVASAMFFLDDFWNRKRQGWTGETPGHSAKAREKVDGFIRLVTEHHMTEHYLAFYAAQLGITPKYLSKLVRDVTGRSAPDWIDSFLVLEAKNMLKYSDMAIKEIVYEMHFPDQSSFYKFFKLHTGMIPSEYRKL